MPQTSGLHVAIFQNHDGVYKHWGLFLDGPTKLEKTVFQIMGSSTRYYFEKLNSDARESADLLGLVHLCDVANSHANAIEDAAENMTIHNEAPGYNCQDYVLELLDDLEERGFIDKEDADYRKNRMALERKQEGLD
ncbi:hypothetical protein CBS147343_6682 [Aspergillus niger]|uniref:uncharacterized protein n=1 Tax=Aspergillus lacticoffeatus (strain CBS 101883) TaxID=1450533 RepID=UPI000D7F075B|nr:uncharacterized protein BO96DRAFT_443959 [Aspergillus niger CBS 101883]KAI2856515.1 hypothetical protein CBS12448_6916 [Aspergillus niger]KAI2919956.1 hypothetical protein CBS147371_3434 [Aspergillus niger]KAI2928176.1 hypothetical protein CBS147320_4708 [Aspergillus niger]KAI2943537.1 hypothetical protein CBS147321_4739 [Aspergillus niger]KAI2957836.1 hypothetical protein CBS147322_1882 [Aspergillus niger]